MLLSQATVAHVPNCRYQCAKAEPKLVWFVQAERGGQKRMLVNFDVLTERLGDEVAVLNLKTNRFFLLNSTGGRLWELLQSESDLAVIERQMLAEFEVDPTQLTAEVKRMLRLFEDEQLVLPTQG
jgi:hypothetical protein